MACGLYPDLHPVGWRQMSQYCPIARLVYGFDRRSPGGVKVICLDIEDFNGISLGIFSTVGISSARRFPVLLASFFPFSCLCLLHIHRQVFLPDRRQRTWHQF